MLKAALISILLLLIIGCTRVIQIKNDNNSIMYIRIENGELE